MKTTGYISPADFDKVRKGRIRGLVSNLYGFIDSLEGDLEEVFFHPDHLCNSSMSMLQKGSIVTFTLDIDLKGRVGARNVILVEDQIVPFKEIIFGYASAEVESSKCPDLLLSGFFDLNNYTDELSFGTSFLLLGNKGSGKSALSEHLKLSSENNPNMFVKNIYLSDFPFVKFSKIVNTDDLPASKYPTAWSWILLIYALCSLNEDQGGYCSNTQEFTRIIDTLKQIGLMPSPDLKGIINFSSKNKSKLSIPKFYEYESSTESPSVDDAIPFLVDKLKDVCFNFHSQSRHLIIIDGLDDILTSETIQFDALSSLLLETSRLNSEFIKFESPCKIILLCRTDLFEKLPGANKNKIRQDNAVFLDWIGNIRSPSSSNLWSLVDNRARLSNPRLSSVLKDYFPTLIFETMPIDIFLLDKTRYIPRDIIQLLKYIQSQESHPRVTTYAIFDGIINYSREYFIPELKDNLNGFIDDITIDNIFKLLSSYRKRVFKRSEILEYNEQNSFVDITQIDNILDALYECSAIGNATYSQVNKEYIYTFKFLSINSFFRKDVNIVIHSALWIGLNIHYGMNKNFANIKDMKLLFFQNAKY